MATEAEQIAELKKILAPCLGKQGADSVETFRALRDALHNAYTSGMLAAPPLWRGSFSVELALQPPVETLEIKIDVSPGAGK